MKMLSKTVKKTSKTSKIFGATAKKIVEIIMEIRKFSHENQEIEIRIKIQQKARQSPENRK